MSETTEISLGNNKDNESKIIEALKKVFGFQSEDGVVTSVCLKQSDIKTVLNEHLDMDLTSQQISSKLHSKYTYRNYERNFDNGKTDEYKDDEEQKTEVQAYFRAVKTNQSQSPLWEVNPDCPTVQDRIDDVGENDIDNTQDFLDFIKDLE